MSSKQQIDPAEVGDSPEWWNRQLTYIKNESFHALRMAEAISIPEPSAFQKGREEDWIKRAEYLRNKAIECVENAYESIRLQIKEEEEN